MSTVNIQTIPVTDVRPGDHVDTSTATSPGLIIRVGAIAESGPWVHIVMRDPGALVPRGFRLAADARVDVYSRKTR